MKIMKNSGPSKYYDEGILMSTVEQSLIEGLFYWGNLSQNKVIPAY